MGDYWRLQMDSRDLNYADYFEVGTTEVPPTEDYHSHNTELLDVEGVKELLLALPEIQADLERWNNL